MVLREPIITVDDNARRASGQQKADLTHYNASLQAFAEDGATRVVWIADFLPEEVASNQQAAMDASGNEDNSGSTCRKSVGRRLTSAVGTKRTNSAGFAMSPIDPKRTFKDLNRRFLACSHADLRFWILCKGVRRRFRTDVFEGSGPHSARQIKSGSKCDCETFGASMPREKNDGR
jgi:hypothetical protein